MNSGSFLRLAAGVLVGGGVIWHFASRVNPAHVAVAIDLSQSVAANCDGLKDISRSWIETRHGIAKNSSFSLLLMGENSQNQEPKLVLTTPIPLPPETMIGQDVEGYETAKLELLEKVGAACRSASSGTGSPIYQMVKQGLAHLRSEKLGCGPDRTCYLLVKTDLEEDGQPDLRAMITRSIKDPSAQLPASIAGSLDNDGTDVTFCGVAEVQTQRGGPIPNASAESRMRIWKQLFVKPERVSFQPYCR